MVAKKTPAVTADKAPRKARVPKPVTDLKTATTALEAAKRKADRTVKARLEAVQADADAQTELEAAKATVKRFYAELMGEAVDAAPDADDAYMEADADNDTETTAQA
jgi:flagellar basal body-associated protein FliL